MVLRANATDYRVIKETTNTKMAYRYLGNTGLKVSVLSYGNWLTSDANTSDSQKLVTDCVRLCFENGVNFFDTAEIYATGAAETQLGIALKALNTERRNIVISTKLMKCGNGVNDSMLSRKHIIEGTRNCLKRLQTDYVDLIFAHRPDYQTPIEETVRAFSWLIDNGLALYWGTSEWPAVKIEQACQLAERLGLHAPVMEQCQYNMVYRDRLEKEYQPLFQRRSYGTTIWSSLAMGFLAGKYNDGSIPEDSRAKIMSGYPPQIIKYLGKYFDKDGNAEQIAMLQRLAVVSKELGYTQAQVAIAWACANQDVSTAILGFSRTSQVEENLKAVELIEKWNDEIEAKVTAVLLNEPQFELNWRTWSSEVTRRSLQYKK